MDIRKALEFIRAWDPDKCTAEVNRKFKTELHKFTEEMEYHLTEVEQFVNKITQDSEELQNTININEKLLKALSSLTYEEFKDWQENKNKHK